MGSPRGLPYRVTIYEGKEKERCTQGASLGTRVDYRSNGDVEMIRWNDNFVVTLCSNACRVDPVRPVKRWVMSKPEMIPQHNVVAKYNKGMGGLDLMDRALLDYRPRISGKKWYWPLLINAINIMSVFSWRVYQLSTNAETKQKDFRRSLVANVETVKDKTKSRITT